MLGRNTAVYVIFHVGKADEAKVGNLIFKEGFWILVPRVGGAHYKEKETEGMIFLDGVFY